MMAIVFSEIFKVSAQIGWSHFSKYFTNLLNERVILAEMHDAITYLLGQIARRKIASFPFNLYKNKCNPPFLPYPFPLILSDARVLLYEGKNLRFLTVDVQNGWKHTIVTIVKMTIGNDINQ